MKHSIRHLQSVVTVALCVIMALAFTSCSDDDEDHKVNNPIVGEWISVNNDGVDIYYQFLSNGTGRYICLADEPGYDPEYPDAVIKHPDDPYYFDYTLEGNILTMKEYGDGEKMDFTIYVAQVEITNDVLQMKVLKWTDDGKDWVEESNPSWDTYKRHSSK